MLPEIGYACLIIAMVMAVVTSIIPFPLMHSFFVKRVGQQILVDLLRSSRTMVLGQWFFVSTALVILGISFLQNDFTVSYVANNSNILLPVEYKVSAIWGGHEGSLLLWVWILCLWTALVALTNASLPLLVRSQVLAVLSMITFGFLCFIVFTSNPFERLLPDFPMDGQDLNPLLQDPGLIFHPPMLYMGYVGFAVPFAFAISALVNGHYDRQWAKWSRPWTKAAWAFLTVGIALGSWWAYYELGWGGWWFWDPVENASLMPWLAGAALLHSQLACEKRDGFRVWTVLIAIITFSLSLLGTFLVRSGVLTSVHAFASDPSRGIFILAFLAVVVGGSLLLFSLRAEKLKTDIEFNFISREFLLMLNNIFLLVACVTVLIGTLFPIFSDVLNIGKISVGPPYFNTLFFPLALLLLFFMTFVPLISWGNVNLKSKMNTLTASGLSSLIVSILFQWLYFHTLNLKVVAILWLCFWLVLLLFSHLDFSRISKLKGSWQKQSSSQKNMHFAHFGLVISVIGITLTSIYSEERDVSLGFGESVQVGGLDVTFHGVSLVQGANYQAIVGEVSVARKGNSLFVLYPEKRFYLVQNNPMTEAAIDAGLLRDIYVALGEDLGEQRWSLRIYYKPFIRFIWLGALIMAFSTGFYLLRKKAVLHREVS